MKTCKADVFSHVCDHRNAQKRSSNSEYERANQPGRDDQQSQYDVIQLGQIQLGPDADHYHSLSPETQRLEPQQPSSNNEYETPNPIPRNDQQSQYEDLQLGQIQPGPDADHYHSLSPETRGEQHQYEVIPRPQRAVPDYVDVM